MPSRIEPQRHGSWRLSLMSWRRGACSVVPKPAAGWRPAGSPVSSVLITSVPATRRDCSRWTPTSTSSSSTRRWRQPARWPVRAAQTLKKIVFAARANAEARRQFAPRYLVNSLQNAPAMAAGRDVRVLTDAYRGVPAVIAAAGPSLDPAIDRLRAVAGRCLLIAVDTALRPLLSAGIEPHLAIGLDPSELNARHFHRLSACPATWLLTESALDPRANRHFGARTLWFRVSDHEPWPWYREHGLDVGLIDVWGSVITAAFEAAVLAGCDPIVFVGADLAFTGGRPYARGTTYELAWAREVAGGRELDEVWQTWMTTKESLTAEDMSGSPIVTTRALLAFRDWLVTHAGRSGRRVINATGAGLLFGPGVEQSTLEASLPDATVVPGIESIVRETPTLAQRANLAPALMRLERAVQSGAVDALTARWEAFCGGRADWHAIESALHAAVADFAAPSRADAVDQAPWSSELLRQLPELVRRRRAPVPGSSAAATGPTAEAAAVSAQYLYEALEPLAALVQYATTGACDLSEADRELGALGLPASFLDWPLSAAAAAEAFDRALTRATQAWHASESADSFFARSLVARDRYAATPCPPEALANPCASAACAILGLDWADAIAATRVDRPVHGAATTVARSAAAALRPDADSQGAFGDLILTGNADSATRRVQLPVRVAEEMLARALTGSVHPGFTPASALEATPRVYEIAHVATPQFSFSAALRFPGRRGAVDAHPIAIRPRVLTDEGVPLAQIAYESAAGIVCVAPYASASFVIRSDGRTEPGRVWPRPILGELPIGTLGVVAWNNGLGPGAANGPAYLMHERPDGSLAVVEHLPFRPGRGAWWRTRLYWTCTLWGIGSWAPGSDMAHALADHSFIHLDVDDGGLQLSPCARAEDGSRLRRRADRAWHWDGEHEPRFVAQGPLGARMARSADVSGWAATAFPEADVVLLESPDGVACGMTCYQPYQLAWLGRSLLVSTMAGELLLFEGLADRTVLAPR